MILFQILNLFQILLLINKIINNLEIEKILPILKLKFILNYSQKIFAKFLPMKLWNIDYIEDNINKIII